MGGLGRFKRRVTSGWPQWRDTIIEWSPFDPYVQSRDPPPHELFTPVRLRRTNSNSSPPGAKVARNRRAAARGRCGIVRIMGLLGVYNLLL
eukprot:2251133-Pyramimonas_sp.AAC.1